MPFRESTISAVIGFSKRSLEPTRTLHRCFTMVPLIKLDSLNVKQFSFRGLKLELLKCLDISFRENLVGPNFCTSCFPFSSLLRFREVAAMSIFRAHSCSKSRVRAIQPHLPTRACIRSALAHTPLFFFTNHART